jgi:hypothetical protein
MAVLVMNAFTRKNAVWLVAAILYHAVLDASAVIGQQYLSSLRLEGVIAIYALISVLVIFKLKAPEPEIEPPRPPLQSQKPNGLTPVPETPENIADTRFG